MKLWRYGRAIEYLGQRYRLEGSLGSGGMADVCLAWDEHENCEVAIKVIKSDQLEQHTLDRFIKEAAQVARWRHPNILRIYSDLKLELLDASQGSIVPYIVMEYAQGGDLHKRLTPGEPYPFAATLDLFAQLCSAVAYAHEHGVIHRDLKPLNILFRQLPGGCEQVVLSDFGLAVEIDATHHTFAHGGTLLYMAPEQFRGYALPASDIFALGVIFYQLCTGHLPFRRSLQDLHRLSSAQPTPPGLMVPTLPEALDDVVLTALAPDPEQRYPTASALWEAIHAVVYSKHLRPIYSTLPRHKAEPTASYPSISRRTSPRRAVQASSQGVRPPDQLLPPAAGSRTAVPGPLAARLELAADSQELPPPISNAAPYVSHTQRRQPISQIDDSGVDRAGSDISGPDSDESVPGLHRYVRSARNDNQVPRVVPNSAISGSGIKMQGISSDELSPGSESDELRSRRLIGDTRSSIAPAGHSKRLASENSYSYGISSSRPARSIYRIGILTLLLSILCVCAVLASLIYFAPARGLLGMLPNPAAIMSGTTVTITPGSQRVASTYTLLAITNGTPDPDQRQIAARVLSAQQAQTKAIDGTGHNQIPATAARGTVTFSNGSVNTFTVAIGTILPAKNGVFVAIDTTAVIPAADPPNLGKVTVPAHTIELGANTNIAINTVNGTCCANGNFIYARNTTAFTGGQDAKSYTFVQQSDVDAFVNATKPLLMQQVSTAIGARLQADEQLTQPASCQASVQHDNPIGDQGQNVPTTNVTVAVSCQAIAYKQNDLRQLVTGLLQQQARTTIGAGYALQGPVNIHIQNQQIILNNNATLLVNAYGTWTYQFSNSQRQQLAHLIAGQSVRTASRLLEQQIGVYHVAISTHGDILPADAGQINIVVQQ